MTRQNLAREGLLMLGIGSDGGLLVVGASHNHACCLNIWGCKFRLNISALRVSHALRDMWRLEPERRPVLPKLRSAPIPILRQLWLARPVLQPVLWQLRCSLGAQPVGEIVR